MTFQAKTFEFVTYTPAADGEPTTGAVTEYNRADGGQLTYVYRRWTDEKETRYLQSVLLVPQRLVNLVDYLEWALDLLDMYDQRMIQLGDPPELVYSEVHVKGKAAAREAIAKAKA